MYYAVPHSADCFKAILFLKPLNQCIRRRLVIGSCQAVGVLLIRRGIVEFQISSAQADAVNLPT